MFDDTDCLNRYHRIMAEQPGLIANVPGCPIRIVTAPAEIAAVRKAVRGRRAAEGHHGDDLRVGVLAEDHYIGTVIRDAVLFPNGEPALYNRVVATGGIAALPIVDGGIALIRIFRHALRRWSLEAPQGIATPGADPAEREFPANREKNREFFNFRVNLPILAQASPVISGASGEIPYAA